MLNDDIWPSLVEWQTEGFLHFLLSTPLRGECKSDEWGAAVWGCDHESRVLKFPHESFEKGNLRTSDSSQTGPQGAKRPQEFFFFKKNSRMIHA